MSIQPATANLPPIQQNGHYALVLRLTDTFRAVTVNNVTSTFSSPCHGFSANEKVVILNRDADSDFSVLTGSSIETFTQSCTLKFNRIYYVSSDGLTGSTFMLSEDLGGTPLVLGGTADTNVYFAARPMSIADYVIDADICEAQTAARLEVATFQVQIVDVMDGVFKISLNPATTSQMIPGSYVYDLSVTPPNGKRFYAMRGTVPVELTRSR
jgi:hypothetical protein